MKHKIDNIKLSQQTKDQLIRLKRITGIEQWNILCRWAFCLSMAEPKNPPSVKIPADSSVEMTWKTFAGEHAAIYEALLIDRIARTGGKVNKESMLKTLRAHITRGVTYLTAKRSMKGIADSMREVA